MRTRLVVLLAVLFALVGGGVAIAGDTKTPPPTAGTANLGGYQIVGSVTVSVPPGQGRSAIATCPAGLIVLGGGERNNSPYTIILTDSGPNGSGGWITYVKNSSTTTTYTFTTWAVCGS